MRHALLIGIALLLVATCAPSPPPPQPTAEPAPDAGVGASDGSWLLEAGTVDGTAIEINDDGRVRMVILGSTLSVSTPCRDFGVDVVVAGGELGLTEPAGVAKPCGPGGTAIDAAFGDALAAVRTAERNGDRLVLGGPDVRLEFSSIPPPALVELTGRAWLLEGLLQGEFATDPVGDPAAWRVDPDGTISGTTGCRAFAGRLADTDDGPLASDVVADTVACPPEVQAQDEHILEVFDGVLTVARFGDRLTIHQGVPGLVYRSGP